MLQVNWIENFIPSDRFRRFEMGERAWHVHGEEHSEIQPH